MFAIVEIAGVQVKVSEGDMVWVPYMGNHEPGEKLSFDTVYLIANGEKIHVGKPIVEGAKVEATLLEHTKGPKLIVFKKRRRKGFHKKQGHRQKYSVIRINQIITSDKS